MADNDAQTAHPYCFEPTLGRNTAMVLVKQAKPKLRYVATLVPVAGHARDRIRIEEHEVIIGRDKSLRAVIPDPSVSRKHARITCEGREFVIEDLGSSNGTHVDGAPIVYCLLHDGDVVQIGQNLFYFERVLEPDFRTQGERR